MEDNNNITSEETAAANPPKKGKKKKIILTVTAAVLAIVLIVFLIPLPMYIKNASFKNGIEGTYVCTDVGSTYKARAEGYTLDLIEDFYLGTSVTVDSDGYIRDIKGFDRSDFKLTYKDDYFDAFEKSYIYYLPEDHKNYKDYSIDYDGIVEVYYNKEGSQIAADTYADNAMLEIYCKPEGYTQNDSGTWFAFYLTFEKI